MFASIIGSLRSEIEAMGFKLLIGLFLTAIVSFSIMQIITLAIDMMDPLVNGSIIQILVLLIVGGVGALSLYFVFAGSPWRSLWKTKTSQPIDTEKLLLIFIDGLNSGLKQPKNDSDF